MSSQVSISPAVTDRAQTNGSLYHWVVLGVSVLVQTSASFGNQMISPLAPFLTADLGLTRLEIGSLVTAFFAGGLLMLTPAGWASDRLGVRRMFLVGLLGCGLPLVLVAQTGWLPLLLVGMFLAGVGNAVALPPTTRAIIYWFPARARGMAMGIKQTGVALAGTITALTIPTLASALSWHGAVLAVALFTMAAGLPSWLLYREHPDASAAQASARVDGSGLRTLLGNRDLIMLTASSLFLGAVQLSVVGFLVLFLKERLGYEVTVAGVLLALVQGAGVVGRIAWGVVSDQIFRGRRKTCLALIAIGSSFCAFSLALLSPDTPPPLIWALLILTGLTTVGWNGLNMTLVGEIAGRRASASAAGLNLTGIYFGILVGPPLFGLLVDASGSYAPAFAVAGVLAFIALLLLSQVRVRQEELGQTPNG